jgi:hypothetical protein
MAGVIIPAFANCQDGCWSTDYHNGITSDRPCGNGFLWIAPISNPASISPMIPGFPNRGYMIVDFLGARTHVDFATVVSGVMLADPAYGFCGAASPWMYWREYSSSGVAGAIGIDVWGALAASAWSSSVTINIAYAVDSAPSTTYIRAYGGGGVASTPCAPVNGPSFTPSVVTPSTWANMCSSAPTVDTVTMYANGTFSIT